MPPEETLYQLKQTLTGPTRSGIDLHLSHIGKFSISVYLLHGGYTQR